MSLELKATALHLALTTDADLKGIISELSMTDRNKSVRWRDNTPLERADKTLLGKFEALLDPKHTKTRRDLYKAVKKAAKKGTLL